MSATTIAVIGVLALLAGTVMGILGGGGGLMYVLILLAAADVQPHAAVGTAVATAAVGATVSAFGHHRQGRVSWRWLPGFLVAGAVGAAGAALLAVHIPEDLLLALVVTVYAVVGVLALRMSRRGMTDGHIAPDDPAPDGAADDAMATVGVSADVAPGGPARDGPASGGLASGGLASGGPASGGSAAGVTTPPARRQRLGRAVIGTITGITASAFAVNGGALITGYLTGYERRDPRRAVGTTAAVLSPLSIVGALVHIANGGVNFGYALALAPGAAVGAYLGSHLTGLVHTRILARVVALLTLSTIISLLLR